MKSNERKIREILIKKDDKTIKISKEEPRKPNFKKVYKMA